MFWSLAICTGGIQYTCINCLWQRPEWPIWLRGPTREPMLATPNVRKKSRGWFGKKLFEWTGSCRARRRHVYNYSDLLQALKAKLLTCLGSQERRLWFLRPQFPLRVNNTQKTTTARTKCLICSNVWSQCIYAQTFDHYCGPGPLVHRGHLREKASF